MGFLNRNHVTIAATNPTVAWHEPLGAFAISKKVGNEWLQTPVTQPFAMDIWQAQHGYEVWVDVAGKKTRQVNLASVSADIPAQPEGATCIYSVPVYSTELGGRRDLIIKGEAPTAAFCDLFDLIADSLPASEPVIPIIGSTAVTTDFGTAPKFAIADWVERPGTWAKPIVTFGS